MLENWGLFTIVPFGLQIPTTHHSFMRLIINILKINSMSYINQISKEKYEILKL
jgi:hypothetical protein